jgi:AraC-like DNA-binding protein
MTTDRMIVSTTLPTIEMFQPKKNFITTSTRTKMPRLFSACAVCGFTSASFGGIGRRVARCASVTHAAHRIPLGDHGGAALMTVVRGKRLSAKEVIGDRIVLQAQRLLIDTDHLAFSEPSSFSKFFHRATGETPTRWRDHHRSTDP